jgi:hypothetical protein
MSATDTIVNYRSEAEKDGSDVGIRVVVPVAPSPSLVWEIVGAERYGDLPGPVMSK